MSPLNKFLIGFKYFWSSIRILRQHPKLKKFIYIPIFISLCFLVLSLFVLGGEATGYLMTLIPLEPGFFYWLIYSLFFVFALLFSILLAFVFANIVSVPFNTYLSEKYWQFEYQWQPKAYTLPKLTQVSLYFAFIGLLKSLILVAVAILCFSLSFFPILSIIVAFIGLLTITFDCCDISFELQEFSLKERFLFFKKHIWVFSGFTLGIAFVSIIPGLNFIFLPFMVLSSSELVYKLINEEKNV